MKKDKPQPSATAPARPAAKRRGDREVAEQVRRLAEPLCADEGLELVHVEYQREPGGRTLRLTLDKPGGIGLDDCVDISRQVGDLLDVKLDLDEPFRLEVTSPGPNRPLGRRSDYERFRSHRVRIRTLQPLGGRKSFTGELLGLFEDGVRVSTPEGVVSIPLDRIHRAQLINYHGEIPCS
jgi:ribosome maturation factor RimP